MKKSFAIALVMVFMLSLLTACGGGSGSNAQNSNAAPATTQSDNNTAPVAPAAQDDNNAASAAPAAQDNNAAPATPDTPSTTQDDNNVSTPPASTQPAQNPDTNDAPGGQAMDSLIRWMIDGKFSYDYAMTIETADGTTQATGSIAIDGDKLAMRQEMTMAGLQVKTHFVSKDGTLYMIDDESKTIMEMPFAMDITEGMVTDYSGIVKTSEGTGEINGKTLPYEEYTESDDNITVRYYLDNGQVYGIETRMDELKTTMLITNASSSVPAGAFDLPNGYTQMDLSSLGGLDFDLENYL